MPERSPRHRSPARPSGRAWLVLGYCLALALMVVIALYGYLEGQRAGQARAAVTHTQRVLQHALELENAAIAMEASHRAYLIRGDEEFLRRRDGYHRHALALTADVRRLVAEHPDQAQRVDQVLESLRARHALMQQTDALAAGAGIASARLNFRAFGDGSIDPIRDTLSALRAEAEHLLAARDLVSARNAARLDALLIYGTGLAFLILVAAGAALLRQLVRTEQIGARLAASNERLEFTYEASGIGAWDLELASGVVARSRLHDRIFGHTSEQEGWNYMRFLQYLHPDDRASVDADIQQAVRTGKDWGRECRILWQDGSLHWIWICGRAADYEHDRPRRMLGTVTDISARKRLEDDLESLFRFSRDLICICSFDGLFLRLNPAWSKTLGHPEEAMLGRPFIDFVHPDDVQATLNETARLAGGDETVLFENRYRTRDGDWRWLLWNAAPSIVGGVIYAVARDITERKQDERRIATLNHDLTERTQALEEANRELEAFAYSVSHDLRAPLRHIDGYARMLMEDAADRLEPEPRRYLRTITESARRMGLLIDDLLALSRLGRKALVRQRVDMRALAEEALHEIPAVNATVSIGRLPDTTGDPSLLKQVWINLLSNALKYSAPRGADARVEVSGQCLGDDNAYTVQDNGVGFDMRYADKLFGVFQRLHPQDQFEGTGVGLAIAHRIVTRHGGRISASAEPDRGASFRFELPQPENAA